MKTILNESDELANKFDFVCCWTCKNCVFELDKRTHECKLTGSQIKGVHVPTECKKWVQG